MEKKRNLLGVDQDPERADEAISGRKSEPITRRGFLNRAGVTAVTLALGAHIPNSRYTPAACRP